MKLQQLVSLDPVRETWVTTDASAVVEHLQAADLWIGETPGTYEYVAGDAATYTIEPLGEDQFEVRKSFPRWLSLLVSLAVAVLPLVLLDPSWLSLLLYFGLLESVWDFSLPVPARDAVFRVEQTVHPSIWVLYVGTTLATVHYVWRLLPSVLVAGVATAAILAYALTRLYSRNLLPWQSTNQPSKVLEIPLDLCRSVAIGTAGFYLVALGTIWFEYLIAELNEILFGGEYSEQALNSVLSDLTGGQMLTVSELELFTRLDQLYVWFPAVLAGFVCFQIISMHTVFVGTKGRQYEAIASLPRQTDIESTPKYTILGLFALWGVVSLGLCAFGGAVVWFAYSGDWVPPAAALTLPLRFLPPESTQTGIAVLTVGVETVRQLVSVVPGPFTDAAASALLALLFLPVVTVSCGLMWRVCLRPIALVAHLATSAPISDEAAVPSTGWLPIVRRSSRIRRPAVPIRLFGTLLIVLVRADVLDERSATGTTEAIEHALGAERQMWYPRRLALWLLSFMPGGRNLYPALIPQLTDRFGTVSEAGGSSGTTSPETTTATYRPVPRSLGAELQAQLRSFRTRFGAWVLVPIRLLYGTPPASKASLPPTTRSFSVLHSQSEIRSTLDRDSIVATLNDFCTDADIEFDADSLTGVWDATSTSILYSWDIEPGPEEEFWVVRQAVRTKPDAVSVYRNIVITEMLLWFILYFIQQTFTGNGRVSLTSTVLILALIAVFLILRIKASVRFATGLDIERYPDPLIDARKSGTSYRKYTPFDYLDRLGTVALLSVGASMLFGSPWMTGSLVVAYAVLAGGFYCLLRGTNGRLPIWVLSRAPSVDTNLSGIARRYLSLVYVTCFIILGFPLLSMFVLFTASRLLPEYSDTLASVTATSTSIPFADLIVVGITTPLLLSKYHNVSGEERKLEYYEFKRRSKSVIGRMLDVSAILVSTAIIYAALLKSIDVLFGIDLLGIPDPFVQFPMTMFLGSLLPLYFPLGVLYQRYERTKRLDELVSESVERELSVDGYEQTCLVYDSEDHYATSFRYDDEDHIVLSRSIFESDRIDPRTKAAIVAHEEGHIDRGDTVLCNRLVTLSQLLLIGQNVLYDLINFQEREYAADEYAASVVGNDAVVAALDFFEAAETETISQAFGASFVPGFDIDSASSRLSRPFELFFGGFALSDAHPSPEQRKARLDEADA